ncbi:MAG: sialidase [Armatimonadetes bacterium CG_4_10_14_3_um_filter_66_18]|nr:exo-alpha-sialidase [Armatimonadota bacterium]OIP12147.1 MAG: hypothetical protein AUJ96_00905 [Armatimonadetes bacterium CG2_30_66_41]PIX39576.1 MAG: sialidase [Armatimonadetes bacterium CG_4_8_14_3_um_filter_66_20]PIY39766.1 MAG: sialidase [Armatimonadetes bacterium CG_4_10_14_3_um_filter_66_18]PIZ43341.1 MAG: sialidase [Armatimonadetes bacterium CG_4_10_14_0_8_um_filter_66_14]PJB60468.1 MAG: sialidase [Armatimonadetes bacterium CG_4_9_14_3_um_filter_66_14]
MSRWSQTAVRCVLCVGVAALSARWLAAEEVPDVPLDFTIRLDTVLEHDDGEFLWFHPRVAAVPGAGKDGQPAVVLTLQKHLGTSDHYSGLYSMRTDDGGTTWTEPALPPELDWQRDGKVDIAVADVTPGYHPQTGKVIALGAQVRYSATGEQLEDVPRAHQTAFSLYDPQTNGWTRWQRLDMPDEPDFNLARNACSQWLVKPDGTLLVPLYHGVSGSSPAKVSVALYRFDGTTLTYVTRGNTLEQNEIRGLAEPSLAFFGGRYYLTVRHDLRGYVTTSDDGLHYEPLRPWTFDDGAELGSYNTQQHWVAQSQALFLVYTRRGADNDHIMRNRAPLFIARVDPERLCVLRATERVLIPERGATLGNFGAAAISPDESWVTVSEGLWNDDARKRGAKGATFAARVFWSRPNELLPGAAE